jgi:hypothetical protein
MWNCFDGHRRSKGFVGSVNTTLYPSSVEGCAGTPPAVSQNNAFGGSTGGVGTAPGPCRTTPPRSKPAPASPVLPSRGSSWGAKMDEIGEAVGKRVPCERAPQIRAAAMADADADGADSDRDGEKMRFCGRRWVGGLRKRAR